MIADYTAQKADSSVENHTEVRNVDHLPDATKGIRMRCSERACPFFREAGITLCRFHRLTFTYSASLEDVGSPVMEETNSVNNLGFNISSNHYRTFSERSVERQAEVAKIKHQRLASGLLIKGAYRLLCDISSTSMATLFSSTVDAQELWRTARFPKSVFCSVCGCEDLSRRIHSAGRIGWQCKLCRHSFNPLSMTYMAEAKALEPNDWLLALWILSNSTARGSIKRLMSALMISESTATRVNWKLTTSASAVGMVIGYRHGSLENMLVNRAQISQGRGLRDEFCNCCGHVIVSGESYRRQRATTGKLDRVVHENCLQLAISSERITNAGKQSFELGNSTNHGRRAG
jgi:hypothetical protein